MHLNLFNTKNYMEQGFAINAFLSSSDDYEKAFIGLSKDIVRNSELHEIISRFSLKYQKEDDSFEFFGLSFNSPGSFSEETAGTIRSLLEKHVGKFSMMLKAGQSEGLYHCLRLCPTVPVITGFNGKKQAAAYEIQDKSILKATLDKLGSCSTYQLTRKLNGYKQTSSFQAQCLLPKMNRRVVFEQVLRSIFYDQNSIFSQQIGAVEIRTQNLDVTLKVIYHFIPEQFHEQIQKELVERSGILISELTGQSVRTGVTKLTKLPSPCQSEPKHIVRQKPVDAAPLITTEQPSQKSNTKKKEKHTKQQNEIRKPAQTASKKSGKAASDEPPKVAFKEPVKKASKGPAKTASEEPQKTPNQPEQTKGKSDNLCTYLASLTDEEFEEAFNAFRMKLRSKDETIMIVDVVRYPLWQPKLVLDGYGITDVFDESERHSSSLYDLDLIVRKAFLLTKDLTANDMTIVLVNHHPAQPPDDMMTCIISMKQLVKCDSEEISSLLQHAVHLATIRFTNFA